ncbi:gliding motility lipoprotein GldD [Altibacter sp. HG106]|uniref:gliding motility lipoprotein GldD n=1 Tax=Altibacter sp. HG106 TaxID=3023937 RepID=UPI002350CDA8|nr:gliding motility lipoprotein GldD [Altibacter sp. HG106]MDC7995210.1 gliding motility lipoprotein GldD [Altibacter sp. HG106]
MLLLLLVTASCGEEVFIKPEAKLRLEYPQPSYQMTQLDCPYNFAKNDQAKIEARPDCWVNLKYPRMNATIYLTYLPIEDNLDSLLRDAQKLTYDHTVKANEILEQPRVDSINKVYGMFYMINGNAATQSQFYATDSLKHFVTGSVYFEAKPNFDSIFPAVSYLRGDIRRIMESLNWRSSTAIEK